MLRYIASLLHQASELSTVTNWCSGKFRGGSERLPAVMPFIQIDGNVIFSPELNDYRKHLESRQTRMSEGGKRSAEARKEKRKPSSRHASAREASTLPTTLQAAHKGDGKVLVQQSSEKKSQTQPLKESLAVDSFVVDYVSEEKRIEPLVRGEL